MERGRAELCGERRKEQKQTRQNHGCVWILDFIQELWKP
jgi:hypothetical protein